MSCRGDFVSKSRQLIAFISSLFCLRDRGYAITDILASAIASEVWMLRTNLGVEFRLGGSYFGGHRCLGYVLQNRGALGETLRPVTRATRASLNN